MLLMMTFNTYLFLLNYISPQPVIASYHTLYEHVEGTSGNGSSLVLMPETATHEQ